jgi:hypothetical protein
MTRKDLLSFIELIELTLPFADTATAVVAASAFHLVAMAATERARACRLTERGSENAEEVQGMAHNMLQLAASLVRLAGVDGIGAPTWTIDTGASPKEEASEVRNDK